MKKTLRRPTGNKFREFQSLGYTPCRSLSFQTTGLFQVGQSSGTEDLETAILFTARKYIAGHRYQHFTPQNYVGTRATRTISLLQSNGVTGHPTQPDPLSLLTYLLTYLRSIALLEKLPIVQQLKNFSAFYGT
jgi:hypothetical protein